ncbi:hypothetical protein [Rhodoferax mekongensis]|uniref:Uncharacterized protein n=1 Tax=Rhodoferax mekongensis TaxID=3068341 RepID=A0ABZ0AWS0_9BURK|nr:hypothetical protein [Rhodoferax sp. TBRC 17307]WNO03939.1 hypothetical protein RAN89_13590 [Rhodoferax sp. TBRC 17307]
MQTFIAIIGGPASGKSTIIKSLTGCPSGQFRGTVVDQLNGQMIEVISASPQEIALSYENYMDTLQRVSFNDKYQGIVCALRPTYPSKRLSIEDVLSNAVEYGFQVHVFILSPGYLGFDCDLTDIFKRLPNSLSSLQIIDGRRFSMANALKIHSISRLIPTFSESLVD